MLRRLWRRWLKWRARKTKATIDRLVQEMSGGNVVYSTSRLDRDWQETEEALRR